MRIVEAKVANSASHPAVKFLKRNGYKPTAFPFDYMPCGWVVNIQDGVGGVRQIGVMHDKRGLYIVEPTVVQDAMIEHKEKQIG